MMVAVSVGNFAVDNHFSWIPLLFIIDNEDIHERVPVLQHLECLLQHSLIFKLLVLDLVICKEVNLPDHFCLKGNWG